MTNADSPAHGSHRREIEGGPDPSALSTLGWISVTAWGLGTLRPASGTWGSLPPVIAVLVLLALGAPTWLIVVAMAVSAIKCSWLCMHYGRAAERAFGRKDPSQVVIDEVAGQSVALLWLPWGALGGDALVGELTMHQAIVAVAAFLLFRAFDIMKPPPANRLQRLEGGAGILIDDLLAGGYALLAAWIISLVLISRSAV